MQISEFIAAPFWPKGDIAITGNDENLKELALMEVLAMLPRQVALATTAEDAYIRLASRERYKRVACVVRDKRCLPPPHKRLNIIAMDFIERPNLIIQCDKSQIPVLRAWLNTTGGIAHHRRLLIKGMLPAEPSAPGKLDKYPLDYKNGAYGLLKSAEAALTGILFTQQKYALDEPLWKRDHYKRLAERMTEPMARRAHSMTLYMMEAYGGATMASAKAALEIILPEV